MSVPSLFLYVKCCVIDLGNQCGDASGEEAPTKGVPTVPSSFGKEIYDILGSQPNAKGADVTCPER